MLKGHLTPSPPWGHHLHRASPSPAAKKSPARAKPSTPGGGSGAGGSGSKKRRKAVVVDDSDEDFEEVDDDDDSDVVRGGVEHIAVVRSCLMHPSVCPGSEGTAGCASILCLRCFPLLHVCSSANNMGLYGPSPGEPPNPHPTHPYRCCCCCCCHPQEVLSSDGESSEDDVEDLVDSEESEEPPPKAAKKQRTSGAVPSPAAAKGGKAAAGTGAGRKPGAKADKPAMVIEPHKRPKEEEANGEEGGSAKKPRRVGVGATGPCSICLVCWGRLRLLFAWVVHEQLSKVVLKADDPELPLPSAIAHMHMETPTLVSHPALRCNLVCLPPGLARLLPSDARVRGSCSRRRHFWPSTQEGACRPQGAAQR
jgi:hypothetical protein